MKQPKSGSRKVSTFGFHNSKISGTKLPFESYRTIQDFPYPACRLRKSQVAQPAPRAELFEAAVDQIDILETIQAAQEEMERRKQACIEKAAATQPAAANKNRGA
jgi:hypothetical protein